MTPFETLIHWISEREAIRLKKEAGAAQPWTDDKILSAWRFCNVDRCDDRETRWIFENLIAAHAEDEALWFNLAIARFINWHPTLEHLGYFHTWDADRFSKSVSSLPGKVYTGAYMIPAGKDGVPKHTFLAKEVFTPLWQLRTEIPTEKRCDQWDVFLRRVACMGDFLRNQIITDLKYTRYLHGAPDWRTFVLAGPGTKRGLNRLHGKPLAASWRQREANDALRALRVEVVVHLPHMADTFDDLNNLANCMCEYDKYRRVQSGEGTPRSRYTPRGVALLSDGEGGTVTPEAARAIRERYVSRMRLRDGLARKAGRSTRAVNTLEDWTKIILRAQEAPTTSMTQRKVGTDSHAKGGSYENRIAKILMAWYGEGVTWTRSPKSGGWASASAFGVKGDLICNVKQPLHIECKNREGWFLDDLLTGVRQRDSRSIMEWWDQTVRDCPPLATPVLIFRRNRLGKDLLMMRLRDMHVLGKQVEPGPVPYLRFGCFTDDSDNVNQLMIFTLQDLVEKIAPPEVTR